VETVVRGLGLGRLMQQGTWLESGVDGSSEVERLDIRNALLLLGALSTAAPLREVSSWGAGLRKPSLTERSPVLAASDGPEMIDLAEGEKGNEFFIGGDAEQDSSSAAKLAMPTLTEARELMRALRELLSCEQTKEILAALDRAPAALADTGAESFQHLMSLAAMHADDGYVRGALWDIEDLLMLPDRFLLDSAEGHAKHDLPQQPDG